VIRGQFGKDVLLPEIVECFGGDETGNFGSAEVFSPGCEDAIDVAQVFFGTLV